MRIYLDNCCYNRPYDDLSQLTVSLEAQANMSENNIALVSKCMDILCEQVGIVDAERFIYIMRSEAFDYTKWQREHYDRVSPDEFDAALDKFSAGSEFKGVKAQII